MPVTTRGLLQHQATNIARDSARTDFIRMTGGTTAQPVQLPAWNRELDHTQLDIWLGRSWYGIRPSSRLFLIWGHSHLLGSGVRGWLRARRREIEDRMLGYHRWSAYDLREEAMQRAGDRLLRFRPEYVMGYSVALDRFARCNASRRDEFAALGVRLVIAAAESFPAPDSREQLQELFRCPVAMEYGSAETNLMAHTHPEGGYRTFWRSYFMEAIPSAGEEQTGKVLVTSLYPRCVPLIRYEIGDEILLEPGQHVAVGLSRFRAVAGRCNDYVELPDGALIHSEAFTHAVRSSPEVKGYQVVQEPVGISIRILSTEPLSGPGRRGVLNKLGSIDGQLSNVKLVPVERLETTIAGKTPMILKRPIHDSRTEAEIKAGSKADISPGAINDRSEQTSAV
jgi:phenylacetate-coenzyme A ligase PaaK-like adenylate-forming protein